VRRYVIISAYSPKVGAMEKSVAPLVFRERGIFV
jgi:hypothetical protein